jgi:hypothetical protein
MSFDANMIVSMIIATSLTSVIAIAGKYINELVPLLVNIIMNIFKKQNTKENKINITSSIVTSANGITTSFQNEYCAIIALLLKNKKEIGSITPLKNHSTYSSYNNNNDSIDNCFETYRFKINNSNKILLDEHIYVRFLENNGTSNEKMMVISYLVLEISSEYYGIYDLYNKVLEWTKEYNNEKKKYKHDGIMYYYSLEREILKNDQADNNSGKLLWKKNIFTTYKTFDNIFFSDKNVFLKKLNYFLHNKDIYKKKGIPYNFGLLFYGNPGCGKTSCIKAISNYTKRHVVEINLSKIKTCSEFVQLFHNDYMDQSYVPHENKIIVLEDIDCMIDIVKSREKNKHDNQQNNQDKQDKNDINDSILKYLLNNEEKDTKTNSNDKLNLSCILNTIDGVLENQGRILIISTNYQNALDKALIRPGRIDAKINFTSCTTKMYFDIIENFYDVKISESVNFVEYKHTPAEVLEICSLNIDNISKSIEVITQQ